MARICILTPGYLVSSPRVVKEADALAEAGHDVLVLHTHGPLRQLARWDAQLTTHRRWRRHAVQWGLDTPASTARFLVGALREKVARRLAPAGQWGPHWAADAECRVARELTALARRHPADLYIGHYPAGLHAAGQAATHHGARLAYDAEDLHIGEFGPEQNAQAALRHPRARRIHEIERHWLPRCAHVTASSRGIAEALAAIYRIPLPQIVYNTFAPSPHLPQQPHTAKDRLKLVWFSQVIGPGRGLENLVEAAARTSGLELHLRGSHISDFIATLKAIFQQHRTGDSDIYFHEKLPPSDIPAWLAQHHIGVACELPNTWNHDLAASNKMFEYLAAGLHVLASPTRGQREVLDLLPCATLTSQWTPPAIAEALSTFTATQYTTRYSADLPQRIAAKYHAQARATLHNTVQAALG